MVAATSNHDAEYIMRHMPYARGLQFRTLFWESKGIELDSGLESASLETIIE
jgi:hypothetical protein